MRSLLAVALLSGCTLIVDPAKDQHPEVTVNSIDAQKQSRAAVAFTGDRYFIVWQDESMTPPDTSDTAIRGRFVSQGGVPEAADFLINDPTTSRGAQEHPAVAVSGSNLLVVWADSSGLGGDSDQSIKGRVISSTGAFITPELLINTTLAGMQDHPQVIAAANDCFFVVWDDTSGAPPDTSGGAIRGRRIRLDGTPLDPKDFVINATTNGDQGEPALARGADDRILVLWEDVQTDSAIRGRLLRADGAPSGGDFVVNTALPGTHENPSVTALRTGGYFTAWTDGSALEDTDGTAVRGRILDGNAFGTAADFLLNTRTRGDQSHPRSLALPDGSLLVAYEDLSMLPPDTDGAGVRAQRFDPYGAPLGDELQVNTYFAGDQERAALAADREGNALAVWQDGSTSPTADTPDVRARVYPAN